MLDEWLRLYHQGLTDRQISDITGISPHTIKDRRYKRKLPGNAPRGNPNFIFAGDKHRALTRAEVLALTVGHYKCGQAAEKLAQEHARPVSMVRDILAQVAERNPGIGSRWATS